MSVTILPYPFPIQPIISDPAVQVSFFSKVKDFASSAFNRFSSVALHPSRWNWKIALATFAIIAIVTSIASYSIYNSVQQKRREREDALLQAARQLNREIPNQS